LGEAAIGADAEGLVATSITVASVKITINAPAKIGQRVYLISACSKSDLAGEIQLQNNTTNVYSVPTITTTPTLFTPSRAMPVSSPGVAANFAVDCTTTGRLSVHYAYGI
jgi:hypothetical protein